MIDKGDITAGIIAAGSALLGQASTTTPGISEVSNLSALGAMIYLVLWTIPKLTRDFRDEMEKEREFHRSETDKIRTSFTCKGEK